MTPIAEDRFRDILSDELGKSEDRMVIKLTSVGLDMGHPIEQQADLRFLRNSRKTARRVAFASVTAAVTGSGAWLWNFLKG